MLLTKITGMRVKCGLKISDIGIRESHNKAHASLKTRLPLALMSS